jgi:hypothetical protein
MIVTGFPQNRGDALWQTGPASPEDTLIIEWTAQL